MQQSGDSRLSDSARTPSSARQTMTPSQTKIQKEMTKEAMDGVTGGDGENSEDVGAQWAPELMCC